MNCRIVWDLLKPNMDPFLPDSPIVIGAGPLVGTLAPGGSKVAATYKYPSLGSKQEEKHAVVSAIGGTKRFGIMLKCAGYDHVVITGKAKRPSYLKIIDDDIEICDASDLWGKTDVYETADELVQRHRGASGGCGVWTIGKAGENLVRWAHAFVDKRGTLGRGGGGALLGSKNLKAVVTLGTKGVRVADPKKFMALVDRKRQEIMNHPLYGEDNPPKGGWDMIPVYPEGLFDRTKAGHVSCATCQGGEFFANVIRDGRFAGQGTQSMIWVLIPHVTERIRIKDGRDAMKFADLVTRYGLCYLTTCRMFRWVTSLYERGVISSDDIGGLELKLGDFKGYVALLKKLVNKEDIGAVMAEGWYPLGKRFGIYADDDFWDGAPIIKGMDLVSDGRFYGVNPSIFSAVVKPRVLHQHQASHDPRGEDIHKDTYGPNNEKSLNDVKRNFEKMGTSKEEANRVFSEEDFRMGRLTKHAEDAGATYNSLGICDNSPFGLNYPTQDMYWLAELYEAATGFKVTAKELKRRGERIFNLEALINTKEGFSREDSQFPSVWIQNIKTPVRRDTTLAKDDAKVSYLHDWFGRRFSEDDLLKILDEYYDERGWNIHIGIPTKEKLTQLGLQEFSKSAGNLPD